MSRLAVLVLLAASACNPVYSLQPVGDKVRSLGADKAEWEGTWVLDEGALVVAVTDADKGRLSIGWFEKHGDKLESHTAEVELRTAGKWTFASVKDPDKAGRYVFARVEKKERQLLLFAAENDAWAALVKAKKLPGTVTTKKGEKSAEIIIGALGAKELAVVASDPALFGLPSALVKISK
jgi:hypothetical protein